jgi:hypothetical protein
MERLRLEVLMSLIRNRMDAAYTDKLDGKVTEDSWQRKMGDWQMGETQVRMALTSSPALKQAIGHWMPRRSSSSPIVFVTSSLVRIRRREPNCLE